MLNKKELGKFVVIKDFDLSINTGYMYDSVILKEKDIVSVVESSIVSGGHISAAVKIVSIEGKSASFPITDEQFKNNLVPYEASKIKDRVKKLPIAIISVSLAIVVLVGIYMIIKKK